MNKLLAYNNDPLLKEAMVAQMKEHMEMDKLVKGTYGRDGKFCAVGCALDSLNILQGKKKPTDEHFRYEKELGIPEILARLEDGLFEEMSKEEAKKFPLRFLEAIPVGADLSMVFTKLVIWEWEDEKHGLKNIKEIAEDKELVDCGEAVVALYKRHLAGEKVETSEWSKLEELADKIYYDRAGAGAGAGAWAWARAGAWARAWAWAGARAGAWAGARAEYEKQISITAEKLLELLRETT